MPHTRRRARRLWRTHRPRHTRPSALICAPITGTTVAGANVTGADLRAAAIEVPGWGLVPKSGISRGLKTHVSHLDLSAGEVVAIEVPGWGLVPKSGISRGLKTHVSHLDLSAGEVVVTVTHYYELVFPVVNHIFAWLHRGAPPQGLPDATGPGGTAPYGHEEAFEEAVGIWSVRAPHMRLRETTRLAMPGA